MFAFQVKTRVLFGVGVVKEIAAETRHLGIQRALLLADKGLVKAGLAEKITGYLKAGNIAFSLFDEIEPNPKEGNILKAAGALRDEKADGIVALGGGSVLDAAKAVAVLGTNPGNLASLCAGPDCWTKPPLPVVAVPTTAGTGSEVSAVSLISFPEEGIKRVMMGRSFVPAVAICDPELTLGLPPGLTASTGIDALSHALEAYGCIRRPNPFSDILCEKAVALIFGSLRQAYANGSNLIARENMLLASTMALMAAANAGGLGVVHAMTHAIGGHYDLPHGLVIAVCLPYGLEFNAIAMPEKYGAMVRILGVDTKGMTPIQAARILVHAVREIIKDLDIRDVTLKSLGVKETDLPLLVEKSMKDGSTPANPRTLRPEDFETLYRRMLGE